MSTRHASRTVTLWALYNTATAGTHFGVVRSGTWSQVLGYLNKTGLPRCLFLEAPDGTLQPLFA